MDQTYERREGPTPAGGAYSEAFFLRDGKAVARRQATEVRIVEYDEHGARLAETFGHVTPGDQGARRLWRRLRRR